MEYTQINNLIQPKMDEKSIDYSSKLPLEDMLDYDDNQDDNNSDDNDSDDTTSLLDIDDVSEHLIPVNGHKIGVCDMDYMIKVTREDLIHPICVRIAE